MTRRTLFGRLGAAAATLTLTPTVKAKTPGEKPDSVSISPSQQAHYTEILTRNLPPHLQPYGRWIRLSDGALLLEAPPHGGD